MAAFLNLRHLQSAQLLMAQELLRLRHRRAPTILQPGLTGACNSTQLLYRLRRQRTLQNLPPSKEAHFLETISQTQTFLALRPFRARMQKSTSTGAFWLQIQPFRPTISPSAGGK